MNGYVELLLFLFSVVYSDGDYHKRWAVGDRAVEDRAGGDDKKWIGANLQ